MNARFIKLSVKEITEMQPTAVGYASERGTVIGGIETDGVGVDKTVVRRFFGPTAKLDDSEPCDGDGCIHYIVVV